MEKVLLIDASPYIFRAYFSLPTSMRDRDGNPVNAVYGFTNFLCQAITQAGAKHIAIAFDESLSTSFRNDFYPEYKAQRDLPPPELEAQLKACREIAEAFGLVGFADSRYEADDFLGTLAARFRNEAEQFIFVSSDKDITQLIRGSDIFWDFARDRKLDSRGVKEQFGVMPEQIVDYLALMGDSVDNIPGVSGVGPKSAVALLKKFETLEGLYENVSAVAELDIRGAKSLQTKLERDRKAAFLSQRLARIAEDAPVGNISAEEIKWTGLQENRIEDMLHQLKFGATIRERVMALKTIAW